MKIALSYAFTLLPICTLAGIFKKSKTKNIQPLNAWGEPSYGVDVSFPVMHSSVLHKDHPNQPLGDKQAFYDDFINGCREFYGNRARSCDITEKDRIAMSLRQPQSMQNYTDTGFKKIRAPREAMDLLNNYWNNSNKRRKSERWPAGNTYVNHWKAPTYMVNVEDETIGGSKTLKQEIWDAVRPSLEEWTGMELVPTSLYGIRIYTEGAVLNPHADRLPLISSCIINVAQDVEEDWPLEVFGRDGLAYNVTMQPGDMVLYESHSLIHGRPFPLKGKYFANIFIHFQPTGKLLRERDAPILTDEGEEEMPIYILRGSPEEEKWIESHPGRYVRSREAPAAAPLTTVAHAAATGDIETLNEIAASDKDVLHKKDANGWQPFHEAVRGGHMDVVTMLVENGANVNEVTRFGDGETPLSLAIKNHGNDHPIVDYLKGLGATLGSEL